MTGSLSGKRVVVTRRRDQAAAMLARLTDLGAVPILLPTIELSPLPAPELGDALARIDAFDWLIFTSANAVRFFFERVRNRPPLYQWPPMAVVGSATASALQGWGHTASAMPDEFTGEALARSLGDLTGQRVLLPRAKKGRPEIVAALRATGAEVADIALYETVMPKPDVQALVEIQNGVDVLVFTSPSTAQNFFRMVDARMVAGSVICCIGPTTAAAVQALGHTVDVMPQTYTVDAMIDALVEYYSST